MNATILALIENQFGSQWTFDYYFRKDSVDTMIINLLYTNIHHTGMTFGQAYCCLERYVCLSDQVLFTPVVT